MIKSSKKIMVILIIFSMLLPSLFGNTVSQAAAIAPNYDTGTNKARYETSGAAGHELFNVNQQAYVNGILKKFIDVSTKADKLNFPDYAAYKTFESSLPIFVQGKPFIIVGSAKYGFNFYLWFAKHIVVYGSYTSGGINYKFESNSNYNGGSIDFKSVSDYGPPTYPDNTGYYNKTSDGGRGEYRYHGYDYQGNKYSNMNFPLDSAGKNMNTYKWLYQPWKRTTYNLVQESIWNQAADGTGSLSGSNVTKVRSWINNLSKEYDNGGADGTLQFSQAENGMGQAWYYAHVMTPPSIDYPGESKLWTGVGSKNTAGIYPSGYRYRTASIEKLSPKTGTVAAEPSTPDIKKVTDFGLANTTALKNEKFPVTLSLTGHLIDEDYAGGILTDNKKVLQTIYYHRGDIASNGWSLTFGGSSKTVQTSSNKGNATYTFTKTRQEILSNRDLVNPLGSTSTFAVPVTVSVKFKNGQQLTATANINVVYDITKVDMGKGSVTVHYVDGSGNSISSDDITANLSYAKYNRHFKLITGYIFNDLPDKSVTLTATKPYQEITFYYKAKPSVVPPIKGTITVKYIDENGDELLPDDVQTDLEMGIYLKYSPGIENCTIQGTTMFTVTLTTANPSQTVTFNYKNIPPLPKTVTPNVTIPETAFDVIPINPVDNTDMTDVASKEVTVDGKLVDYNTFFSGSYTFGVGNSGLRQVIVMYTSVDDMPASVVRWVTVYNTKPRVEFALSSTYKQNHKLTVTNTSASANDIAVLTQYPITSYIWSFTAVDGVNASWVTGTSTDLYKELTYKKPGTYKITLQETNSLGRTSDPYTVDFEILSDILAAIICNLDKVSLARGDCITAYYFDAVSIDGDSIASRKLELWYDSNNDGTVDQLKQTWLDVPNNTFPSYTPTQLGMYSFVITVTEKIEGDIIPAHVTGTDAMVKTTTREFWCDNYVPMTELYVDAPAIRANADVFIMADANLSAGSTTYLQSGIMDFSNYLRTSNIISNVSMWDMHTYTYTQAANTSINTGTTGPAASTYYTSNGYSGTLPRTSVSDNGYWNDYGKYVTVSNTDYTTGTAQINSGTSYPPGSTYYSSDGYTGTISLYSAYDTGGNVSNGTEYSYKSVTVSGAGYSSTTRRYNGSYWSELSSSASNNSTYYYSDDSGYSGTLSQTSFWVASQGYPPSNPYVGQIASWTTIYNASYGGSVSRKSYVWRSNWVGQYSGTVSKSTSSTAWQSDWKWVANYTGFYNGTISKSVRQPYINPFTPTSDKYVIYVSDDNIAELNDLKNVISQSGANLILVTGNSAISQITYKKYLPTTGVIATDIKSALDYIAGLYASAVSTYTILVGAPFIMNTSDFDPEGDTIITQVFQYVQDQNQYDNPMGLESYAVSQYSESTGWVITKATTFNTTGGYTIYRRIKDKPSTDPSFAGYSYYSDSPLLKVNVVRKPIALATLDWNFNALTGNYAMTWVDASYSREHQYNRPDKGIAASKIMFRQSGGQWQYTIPSTLVPGTYELNYYVQSVEGFWSDPYVMNFTLSASPPMQFNAALKAENSLFTTASIPASENLQVYNAWTRYPYNVNLQMALYNSAGTTLVVSTKTVNYSATTGTKTDSDINWNNISYAIPATLADGNYTFRITAVGDYGQNKTIDYPVTVSTPINLQGYINYKQANAEIKVPENNNFTFITSKYITSVQLTFKGVIYISAAGHINLTDNDGTTKTWQMIRLIADGTMIDGETGIATFRATLPTGVNQNSNVNYTVRAVRASNFKVTMMYDASWRGYYFNLNSSTDTNGDGIKDTFTRLTNTDIFTPVMPINYYNLVSFAQQGIKAGYRVKGSIDIAGTPDNANFNVSYLINSATHIDNVPLSYTSGNTYTFDWIIPLETDQNSLVKFDLVVHKGVSTYGNEKWNDTWGSLADQYFVFYIKGKSTDDLVYVQGQ